MKGKILFVVGLGAGYVLGARAGRERYEQIRRAALNVWNQPQVQQGVDTVKDFAKTRVGDLSGTVLDGVKGLIGNATKSSGSTTSTTSTTSGTSGASATRPSPTTSKPATTTATTTTAKRSSTSRGEKLTPPTGTATNPATSPDSSGA